MTEVDEKVKQEVGKGGRGRKETRKVEVDNEGRENIGMIYE